MCQVCVVCPILPCLQSADCLTEELHSRIEDLRHQMLEICIEPQISIPDVFFWVLTKDKRRAFCRVPVGELLFHSHPSMCGEKFGQVQTVFLNLPRAGKIKSSDVGDVPAQLQFRAWFGARESEPQWPAASHAEIALVAETYENQRYLPVKGWGNFMLPTDRAKWSSRDGKRKQNIEGKTLTLYI